MCSTVPARSGEPVHQDGGRPSTVGRRAAQLDEHVDVRRVLSGEVCQVRPQDGQRHPPALTGALDEVLPVFAVAVEPVDDAYDTAAAVLRLHQELGRQRWGARAVGRRDRLLEREPMWWLPGRHGGVGVVAVRFAVDRHRAALGRLDVGREQPGRVTLASGDRLPDLVGSARNLDFMPGEPSGRVGVVAGVRHRCSGSFGAPGSTPFGTGWTETISRCQRPFGVRSS